MRAKLVTFGFTAAAILALVLQASSQAIAQGNANKPVAAKKSKPAPKPPQAKPAAPAPAAADATTAAKAKPKPKPKRKAKMAMSGVPNGVPNCIKHLSQMAAKDPLIDYDGHPSEIIVGGLLWNDPKSHCSIASDETARKKVIELAGAWRRKDASQVRSILQELEGMAK